MENYSSIFSLLPAPFGFIAAVIVLLFVFQYIRNKTNSSYGLLDKLWGLLIGGKSFKNNSILEFHEEMQDIDRFNLIYNMKAKNTEEITKMKHWLKENNYDIRDLSKLGSFFDIGELKIKKPKKLGSFGIFLLLIAMIPVGFLCFVPLVSFGAITKTSDSDTLMVINAEKAIVLGEHFAIHKDDCSFKKIEKDRLSTFTKLSPNDIDDICEAFNDEAFKRIVVSLKRIESIFSIFGFGIVYFFIILFLELNRRMYASTFISRHSVS
ncbi:DUF6216 family protein [Pantoea sp. JK]|uniref:DUF6216 family protein n=1 Tax=Pantoea sp. JK TaxID=2871703 RepID=UPI0022390638|nr:DUF6216 family protein [Pantoea sp. JK]MCW6030164.1 DUF6216 family protein [Pantoea sp. JK]